MENLIAYCGLDCAQCGAYLAHKNNDQALREKTAAEWKIAHGYDGPVDMVNCTGCKGNGVLFSNCMECPIRECAIKKGVENCGACDEFETCKTINDFIAEAPFVKEHLTQKLP